MDLLLDSEKNAVFEAKKKELEEIAHTNRLTVDIAKTSIWDKTLYSAWSKIVTQLIPKKEKFQTELQNLAEQSGANEGKSFRFLRFLSYFSSSAIRKSDNVEYLLHQK